MKRVGLMGTGTVGLRCWISIIICSVLVASVATLCFADLSGSLDEKSIIDRIKPEGEVTVEKTATTPAQTSTTAIAGDIGKQKYDQYCHVCHGPGLAGAPKFEDKADWAPRIAEGIEILVKHALEGYKAMPAKGTCSDCSADDIRKTVEYMISHSK